MAAPTRLVTPQLARDLSDALARLRMARELDPRHELLPGAEHSGCEVCTSERRFNWLMDKL